MQALAATVTIKTYVPYQTADLLDDAVLTAQFTAGVELTWRRRDFAPSRCPLRIAAGKITFIRGSLYGGLQVPIRMAAMAQAAISGKKAQVKLR